MGLNHIRFPFLLIQGYSKLATIVGVLKKWNPEMKVMKGHERTSYCFVHRLRTLSVSYGWLETKGFDDYNCCSLLSTCDRDPEIAEVQHYPSSYSAGKLQTCSR